MAEFYTIPEGLKKFRDDMITWVTNNLNVRVPNTRKINNKTLDKDISLTHTDVGADQVGAAQTAKSEAVTAANQNTTLAVAGCLTEAKAYTDQKVSDEASNRATAISNEAKARADAITQAINTEVGNRDTAIETAKQAAINSANQNTNSLISTVRTEISELKTYTDNLVATETESIINDEVSSYTETWSSRKISGKISDEAAARSTAITQLDNKKFDKANFSYSNGVLTITL